jgi:hypothetical protein
MAQRAKGFPQVRMRRGPGMDEPRPEKDEQAPAARSRRDERARAAAYLDLWQRHVSQAAVHGPEPPARPPE